MLPKGAEVCYKYVYKFVHDNDIKKLNVEYIEAVRVDAMHDGRIPYHFHLLLDFLGPDNLEPYHPSMIGNGARATSTAVT